MKILLLVAGLTFLNVSSAHTWASAEDQIKGCLALMYLKEVGFHQTNKTYADDVKKLDNSYNEDCKKINVKVLNATKDNFLIQADNMKSVWTIDSVKVMKQIK